MKIFNFFTKNKAKNQEGSFADFFLHASDKEKKKVFLNAARQANEDQRSLVKRIKEIQHKAT
jgi:hypothetical protein